MLNFVSQQIIATVKYLNYYCYEYLMNLNDLMILVFLEVYEYVDLFHIFNFILGDIILYYYCDGNEELEDYYVFVFVFINLIL
jgi:hypothetical protein